MWIVLAALGFAAAFSLMFGLLGWRRPGGGTAWSGMLFFFAIVWLATAALGALTPSDGSSFVGGPLLTAFFIALVVSLSLAAAATPSPEGWRRPGRPGRGGGPAADGPARLGLFFWVLIIVLFSLVGRWLWTSGGAGM